MPVDRKRVNGPEVSVAYDIYVNRNLKNYKISNNAGKRVDGRTNDECRKIFSKTGVVSQAKGSAYIEMGNTKVVCSVFDPREVPNKNGYCVQGELFCEFKFASFSCSKRKIHQQNAEEKEYSLLLQRALEPAVCLHEFPNFQVDVYAIVLDNSGSSLAAAIMGSSLALANAGVPMFGLVTASSVGIYNDITLLDPTEEEEICCTQSSAVSECQNYGIIMQSDLPQHGQVSEVFLTGCIDVESIVNAIKLLKTANKDICPILQQCLVKTVVKTFKESNHNSI